MNPEILAYIITEVEHQGYDVHVPEGAKRVLDMQGAWELALDLQTQTGIRPDRHFVLHIGQLIEPDKNPSSRWRNCGVRVGRHIAPSVVEVPRLMERWFANRDSMTPNEAYIEFEIIHPFVDGNGRTGKIIFNWLNGTLEHPVWPEVPSDWGIA